MDSLVKAIVIAAPFLVSCGSGSDGGDVTKNSQADVNQGALNGTYKGGFYHVYEGYAGAKFTINQNDVYNMTTYLGSDKTEVPDGATGTIFTQGETFKLELNGGGSVDYVSINNEYLVGAFSNGYAISVYQKGATSDFGSFTPEDIVGKWVGKDYFFKNGELQAEPFTITCTESFDCTGKASGIDISATLTNYDEVYGAYTGLVSSGGISDVNDFILMLSLDKKVIGVMSCSVNGCDYLYGVKQ